MPDVLIEKLILSLGRLSRTRTLRVIVRHVVHPSAYGIAAHPASITWLQQFRDRLDVIDARSEPKIIVIRVENHRHSVVNG